MSPAKGPVRYYVLAYTVAPRRLPAVTEISEPVAARFGRTSEQILADPEGFAKLVHSEDRNRVLSEHTEAATATQALTSEYRMVTRHGEGFWVHDEALPTVDPTGEPHLRGHVLDTTLRNRREALLHEREEHFKAVVANIPGVVYRCACDPKWTMFFMSDHMNTLTGYPAGDFIDNRRRTYGSIIHPDDHPQVIKEIDEALARGSAYSLEYRLIHADGRPVWIAEHGRAILDERGNPKWLDGVILDISRQKSAEESRDRAEEQLRHQALFDALTELPNRTLFHDRTVQAIADARRQKTQLAVLMMDLDRFKEINDRYGHEAGDRVLTAVAERLQGSVREGDTIARWGGDEFALLLRMASVGAVLGVLERIRAAVERPIAVNEGSVSVGLSVGIACFPRDGEDVITLLRHADFAMYEAKEGHLGYALYDAARDRGPSGKEAA